MRRTTHAAASLFTALSLVLFLATVAMAVRSYRVHEEVFVAHGDDRVAVDSDRGKVMIHELGFGPGPGWGRPRYARWSEHGSIIRDALDGQPKWCARLGFEYQFNSFGLVRWLVQVPYWFPALLFGLPPALAAYRRRRRPRPSGTCRARGYDLRATPDRCPECGRRSKRADLDTQAGKGVT